MGRGMRYVFMYMWPVLNETLLHDGTFRSCEIIQVSPDIACSVSQVKHTGKELYSTYPGEACAGPPKVLPQINSWAPSWPKKLPC